MFDTSDVKQSKNRVQARESNYLEEARSSKLKHNSRLYGVDKKKSTSAVRGDVELKTKHGRKKSAQEAAWTHSRREGHFQLLKKCLNSLRLGQRKEKSRRQRSAAAVQRKHTSMVDAWTPPRDATRASLFSPAETCGSLIAA